MFFQNIVLMLTLCIAFANTAYAQNTRNDSFEKAKRLAATVYADQPATFYCGCPYQDKKVNFSACNYVPPTNLKTRKVPKRPNELQWEHVVPAENFGRSFPEWREPCANSKGKSLSKRICLRKKSQEFRFMEADLYNLVPESRSANRWRSNYQMGMIQGEARRFGACDMEIEDRTFEPRPEIRGNIARIYFYMDWAYPRHGIISRQLRPLFEIWHRKDPVDIWERERAKRIEKLQGNKNPFVE